MGMMLSAQAKVLIQDPCPFGLLERVTRAHTDQERCPLDRPSGWTGAGHAVGLLDAACGIEKSIFIGF